MGELRKIHTSGLLRKTFFYYLVSFTFVLGLDAHLGNNQILKMDLWIDTRKDTNWHKYSMSIQRLWELLRRKNWDEMLVMGGMVDFSVRSPEQKDIQLELDGPRCNELIVKNMIWHIRILDERLDLNASIRKWNVIKCGSSPFSYQCKRETKLQRSSHQPGIAQWEEVALFLSNAARYVFGVIWRNAYYLIPT